MPPVRASTWLVCAWAPPTRVDDTSHRSGRSPSKSDWLRGLCPSGFRLCQQTQFLPVFDVSGPLPQTPPPIDTPTPNWSETPEPARATTSVEPRLPESTSWPTSPVACPHSTAETRHPFHESNTPPSVTNRENRLGCPRVARNARPVQAADHTQDRLSGTHHTGLAVLHGTRFECRSYRAYRAAHSPEGKRLCR